MFRREGEREQESKRQRTQERKRAREKERKRERERGIDHKKHSFTVPFHDGDHDILVAGEPAVSTDSQAELP